MKSGTVSMPCPMNDTLLATNRVRPENLQRHGCGVGGSVAFFEEYHQRNLRLFGGRVTGEPSVPPRTFLDQRSTRLARGFHCLNRLRQVSHSVGHGSLEPSKHRRQHRVALLRQQDEILV